MIQEPEEKPPLLPLEILPGPPTQPGWYWWKRDAQSREIMLGVRLRNREVTVWWPNQYTRWNADWSMARCDSALDWTRQQIDDSILPAFPWL